MNLAYAHCPNCGSRTELKDEVRLFDTEGGSEVIFEGKCHICGYAFKVSYPLSKSEPG